MAKTKTKPPGRPKGAQNRLTKTAKEAIEFAASKLGGGARLFEWAQEDSENERAFWTSIYPKLLPLQVSGPDGGAVQVDGKWVVEFVNATPKG
jgi:hypothetical protein